MMNQRVKIDLVTNVRDDLDGKNIQNLDNPVCMKHNDNLDEMMNDVAMDFIDIPKVFENLCNNSKYSYILIVRSL
jgi:hypothetical protein